MTRINILFCLVIIEFYKYTKLRVLPPQGSSHQKAQLKHTRTYVPIFSHLGPSLLDKWPRQTHRQTIKCSQTNGFHSRICSPLGVRIHNSAASIDRQCIAMFCVEIIFFFLAVYFGSICRQFVGKLRQVQVYLAGVPENPTSRVLHKQYQTQSRNFCTQLGCEISSLHTHVTIVRN